MAEAKRNATPNPTKEKEEEEEEEEEKEKEEEEEEENAEATPATSSSSSSSSSSMSKARDPEQTEPSPSIITPPCLNDMQDDEDTMDEDDIADELPNQELFLLGIPTAAAPEAASYSDVDEDDDDDHSVQRVVHGRTTDPVPTRPPRPLTSSTTTRSGSTASGTQSLTSSANSRRTMETMATKSTITEQENATKQPKRKTSERTTSSSSSSSNHPDPRVPKCRLWTHLTEGMLHPWILRMVTCLATHAARHPKWYIGVITCLSFSLAGVGMMTGLEVIFDHEILFTPTGSRPQRHGDWIYNRSASGFDDTADLMIIVHADGTNVLQRDAMNRVFVALDTLRQTPGYDALCATSSYINLDGDPSCWVWSVSQFWNHNLTTFEQQVMSEEQLVEMVSQSHFPDDTPVYQEAMFGKFETTIHSEGEAHKEERKVLSYVPNYIISVGLPDTVESEYFQEVALERLLALQQRWAEEDATENPHAVRLEFFTSYAYFLEYERALMNDMPLVPVVFYVMLLFTCTVFHFLGGGGAHHHHHHGGPSRYTLGLYCTWTIGMSLASGYGLMFCLGIPFTNLSQMLPFIVLGVGLDDSFIITGAYFRRLHDEEHNHRAGNVEEREDDERFMDRIRDTMNEVGLSITLTTATTTFAFALGCLSTIPGIQWLCLYACATILFVFGYQITYFVALLALDERRVTKAKARDEYLAIADLYATRKKKGFMDTKAAVVKPAPSSTDKDEAIGAQRIMRCYAQNLLRPWVKKLVVFMFTAFFAICVWRTTLLTQEFVVTDYVPEDSFTGSFMTTLDRFSSIKVPMAVYFRNVNQSDPVIQQQMRDYIGALSALPQINQPPDFCWVTDLHKFYNGDFGDDMDEKEIEDAKIFFEAIQAGNKTFAQQLDIVLSIPTLRDVYGSDIVRDEQGEILSSRCYLFVRHLDLKNIQQQIQMLFDQREITQQYQPESALGSPLISRGLDGADTGGNKWWSFLTELFSSSDVGPEWSFFTFEELYYYWELYTVAVKELVLTTISGVAAVCLIGFLLIPHWTATFIICPTIVMLYFNLLGTLQYCGVHINAVTYVLIVISIGLLVDFVMHILLRYYETPGKTREAKVIGTLETMGASMMMGGISTWLGVIPLVFSSTKIFNTVFIAFLAMVSLGLLVGLVFMPVVLSMIGPLVCIHTPKPADSSSFRSSHSRDKTKQVEGPAIEKKSSRLGSIKIRKRPVEETIAVWTPPALGRETK